jgi:perosamine synthetase
MAYTASGEPMEFPTWPCLSADDVEAVAAVLRSSRLSQLSSDAVSRFESGLADFVGTKYAVAVNSGTAALHTALAALDIGAGDEVLVPSHTFIGSASPVVHQGATPVFVDVDDQTYCLSPESVRRSLTGRTRAIIAVHLNGAAAPLDEIVAIAEDRGLPVIEDVAQAIGGTYRGRPLGSIGNVSAFSFWEGKIITTGGEGGAVLTDDAALAERMRRFRHHGESRAPGARVYTSVDVGHNYRLTAPQAALGASQMQRIGAFLEVRRSNALDLTAALSAVHQIQTPIDDPACHHARWKYVCRVPGSDEETIDRITVKLRDRGVPAFRRYPVPLHRQPAFLRMGLGTDQCPVSERLATELFSLPVHPLITGEHIGFMAETITNVIAESPVKRGLL